jgi:SRSO17 transposase
MSQKRNRKHAERKQAPASSQPPKIKLAAQDKELICQALVDYHHLFDACFQRREQRQWSAFYLCGQLSDVERKTIEPMVLELLGPQRNVVRAMQQFIGQGQWSADLLLYPLQALVAETLGDPHGVLIVDGSGFPKQGAASVGVARQYCGALGKIANCQEGVFALYVSPKGYTFVDVHLYLPEDWFDAAHHRLWQACGIPPDTAFRTEPELALDLIDALVERAVLPFQWIACDEHFGQNPAFLDALAAFGKWYFAEVPCDTRVWLHTPAIELPGRGPLGRPRLQPRVKLNAPRAQEGQALADARPQSAWRVFLLQEGSQGPLHAEFACVRVTTVRNRLPGPRGWAIVRRNLSTPREVKYYLSNAPTTCTRHAFANLSGLRWPIETGLEEGKGEVGMDQYETRTWRGWHHHMAHTFIAHFFLMRMRLQFKKSPGTDDGTGAARGQRNYQRRTLLARHARHRGLSATSKLCRISFTSQTHPPTLSAPHAVAQKARSLVVM